jgi:hypothetical protein
MARACSVAVRAASMSVAVVAAKPQVPSTRTRTLSPWLVTSLPPSTWWSRMRSQASRTCSTRHSAWVAPPRCALESTASATPERASSRNSASRRGLSAISVITPSKGVDPNGRREAQCNHVGRRDSGSRRAVGPRVAAGRFYVMYAEGQRRLASSIVGVSAESSSGLLFFDGPTKVMTAASERQRRRGPHEHRRTKSTRRAACNAGPRVRPRRIGTHERRARGKFGVEELSCNAHPD